MVQLGANLRYLRVREGWSQEDLARAVAVSRVSIGRIERGEQNPSLLLLCRIAGCLDVDLIELVARCDWRPVASGP